MSAVAVPPERDVNEDAAPERHEARYHAESARLRRERAISRTDRPFSIVLSDAGQMELLGRIQNGLPEYVESRRLTVEAYRHDDGPQRRRLLRLADEMGHLAQVRAVKLLRALAPKAAVRTVARRNGVAPIAVVAQAPSSPRAVIGTTTQARARAPHRTPSCSRKRSDDSGGDDPPPDSSGPRARPDDARHTEPAFLDSGKQGRLTVWRYAYAGGTLTVTSTPTGFVLDVEHDLAPSCVRWEIWQHVTHDIAARVGSAS